MSKQPGVSAVAQGKPQPVPGWFTLHAGYVYLDHQARCTLGNDLAAGILQVRAPIGQPLLLSELFPVNRPERRTLAELLAGGRDVHNELVQWEQDGDVRYVILDAFCERGPDGWVNGVHVVMKDVGDLAGISNPLTNHEKLAVLSRFAAGIAHELRNPLTTLRGFLQLWGERDGATPYKEIMLREIERMQGLVDELLLLSGPRRVERVHCYPEQVLAELLPDIEERAKQQGVRVHCEWTDTPGVWGEPGMLRLLLSHLMDNALEAMENGGLLTLRVRTAGSWVEIEVSDTGPGIQYYQMDNVFDAFFTTKEKGTGLGFPICQRIVADHHGRIRVSSKGFGTTLSVRIPVCTGHLTTGPDLV
ncbi:MAG: two-component sensor histidine kinase [Alicyclobacillus sp.]|nr:two-component sensor histidine kinase [Alicyclobacillus sp.]